MSLTDLLNNQWAFHLVDQLILQGVCDFWIGPGSRNTPLILAVANHPKSKSIVHFDERGLAYHALGFSKASNSPVAIIVTTGTAVGNLLPAIMEAWENQIPLMILSADRPPELRECSANQTTSQTKIFQSWTSWHTELVCPSNAIPIRYISSVIAYAAEKLRQGPVHLNCQFREPFFSDDFKIDSIEKSTYHIIEQTISKSSIEKMAKTLNSYQKGILILGELTKEEMFHIYPVIEILGWPVYADILSNEKCFPSHEFILRNFSRLITNRYDLFEDTECILQFGHKIVSKKVQQFIQKLNPSSYFLVSKFSKKEDALLLISDQIRCFPKIFCKEILPFLKGNIFSKSLRKLDDELQQIIDKDLNDHPNLTEPFIHAQIGKYFPKEHSIFFGNSMPIRDANAFFTPKNRPKSLFFNRGVSGIDGNVATCFGIAKALDAPLIAVLGDLTMLHDLNSLAFAKYVSNKVTFFILNNQGGGIFSHLPIHNIKDHFGKFFATEHFFNFEHAAHMFNIDYALIETKQSFLKLLIKDFSKKTQIIELKIKKDENLAHHQKINHSMKQIFVKEIF